MTHWSESFLSDEADKLPGKAKVNFEKAASFKAACEMLEGLKAKGVLDFEAEDPREQYSYHTIQIRFKFDENGDRLIKTSELIELLSKVDELLVTEGRDDWQLGSRLYGMID